MARPLRIEYEGAWYHVMNRGAGRRRIFKTDTERRIFLALLGELNETFGVGIHAYCLMPNHYHLLLETPRANLSLAMRHLSGVYTQRMNRRASTDGPLFRGRFKATLIDADSYLAQLSRYIHLNPLEARLVRHPGNYPWSSYRAYLGRVQPPDWLTLQAVLALFGKRGAWRRYQEFVESGVDEQLQAFYKSNRLPPVLGSDVFRQRIAKQRIREPRAAEIPDVRYVETPPSIAYIVKTTAEAFKTPIEQVYTAYRGRRQRNVARTIAIGLSRGLTGKPLRRIADAFGMSHYASVSGALRRYKGLIVEDQRLARKVERIKKRLVQ